MNLRALIGFLFVICVLVFGVLWYVRFRPEATTGYANPLVKSRFSNIHTGDTFDQIYERLGNPIYFSVISSKPDEPIQYDYDVNKEHLSQVIEGSNLMVNLHYSTNNGFSGWYFRYEIEMQGGKVIRVLRDLQD
jgi:hypothetical protein